MTEGCLGLYSTGTLFVHEAAVHQHLLVRSVHVHCWSQTSEPRFVTLMAIPFSIRSLRLVRISKDLSKSTYCPEYYVAQ